MFHLTTPTAIKQTAITFDQAELEAGTCGLFRAPLHEAADLMPSMAELIASVPAMVSHTAAHWELDIKVHMLMAGQYPCIPNWHCDNVERDEQGLRYDRIKTETPPMFLWVSDGPLTEFLLDDALMPSAPGSHIEVARFIREHSLPTRSIEKQTWTAIWQDTPHRGCKAAKSGWRVFARLTHKSIAPARPVISTIRRHAQVYLDAADFGW